MRHSHLNLYVYVVYDDSFTPADYIEHSEWNWDRESVV